MRRTILFEMLPSSRVKIFFQRVKSTSALLLTYATYHIPSCLPDYSRPRELATMLLKSFIPSLLLISTASCAAVLRQRDVTDVTDAIAKTKSDLKTLSDAIDNFKGDIASGFPILQASWAVQSDVTAATDIVNAIEGKLAGKESKTVADSTNDLANDVVTVLANLGTPEKIELVKKLGSSIVAGVKTQLQNLQTSSGEFMSAVVDKVAESEATVVQASADKVNTSFDEVIAKIPA